MDGYEVCHQLRRSFLTSSIPIIMLTALTSASKIKGSGADITHNPHPSEELANPLRGANVT